MSWNILLVALFVRLFLVIAFATYVPPENSEVVGVARALASGNGFSDAYGPGTGPTAHVAPLYPLILSLIYRLAGDGETARLLQSSLSCLFAAALYALLPWGAVRMGLPRVCGVLAGWAGALLPINFWTETRGSFEASLAALLIFVSMSLICQWWRGGLSRGECCGLALLSGSCAVTIPSWLLPLGALLLTGAWICRHQLRSYSRCAVFIALVTLLFTLPWAVRNEKVMGKAIFTRSNLGLELWLSNQDHISADFLENTRSGLLYRLHPHNSRAMRATLVRMGEVPHHEWRMRQATAWIRDNPARFLALTAERAWLFWMPRMMRWQQSAVARALSLAGLVGLVWWWRSRQWEALPYIVLFCTFPLTYYLVYSYARYRYPIEWALQLLAAHLTVAIWSAFSLGRFSLSWRGTRRLLPAPAQATSDRKWLTPRPFAN